MPSFDRGCLSCDWYTDFVLERHDAPDPPCPKCGGATCRPWRGRMANIIRDEYTTPLVDDVMTPDTQVFHSKSEHRAAMKLHGLQQLDRHVGTQGSDKSPHTTRWDVGLPPGYDGRPMAMLTADEQAERRKEWHTT
jgi:hypothetical protein